MLLLLLSLLLIIIGLAVFSKDLVRHFRIDCIIYLKLRREIGTSSQSVHQVAIVIVIHLSSFLLFLCFGVEVLTISSCGFQIILNRS